MTTTTLLIDGDLFAYQLACASETGINFGETFVLSADADLAKANLDALMVSFKDTLKADHIVVALSDTVNYRKVVMPSYKSNRADIRRPMVLQPLLQHFRDNYQTYAKPGLEADDVLGILLTNPKLHPGVKICVTEDKDLRSVPGLHWNSKKEGVAKTGPTLVTEEEADYAFLAQAISGDIVDGYSGCPGIGKARAAELVRSPCLQVYREFVVARGKNAGTVRGVYETEPTTDVWAAIVSHYEKAGLTEADAIAAAQVARILRHEDYNYKEKAPILWLPNRT